MTPYADANILVRYYLHLDRRDEARALIERPGARAGQPLRVSTLLRFEICNALQRMIFEGRTSGQWRVTPELAAAAQADFEEDLANGSLLMPVRLTLEEIEPRFDHLVGRHTAKHGFRTYDLVHVASAIYLECDTFWSFDAKALKLAKLEGLKTDR